MTQTQGASGETVEARPQADVQGAQSPSLQSCSCLDSRHGKGGVRKVSLYRKQQVYTVEPWYLKETREVEEAGIP